MSTEDVLSQEEVDNLLKGITGDTQETEVKPVEPTNGGVSKYNLAEQERIVRARMPTLEIISERLIKNLRTSLFNFTRKSTEVSALETKVQKFSSFLSELVVPTNLNIVAFKPLRGYGLVTCEPKLIFAMIDAMFGGSGKFHMRIEGREFSNTETRVIKKIVELISDDFKKSWSSVYPLEFEYQRSEMQPQFVNITSPNEIVVTICLQIDFGDTSGMIYITIPYASLEPIKDILYSSVQGESAQPDQKWVNTLKGQIKDAQAEMTVDLGVINMTLKELLSMKKGDFFPVLVEPKVEAKIDNIPVFSCLYGKNNGRHAIQIDKKIVNDTKNLKK